jgi:hypothetical protein
MFQVSTEGYSDDYYAIKKNPQAGAELWRDENHSRIGRLFPVERGKGGVCFGRHVAPDTLSFVS